MCIFEFAEEFGRSLERYCDRDLSRITFFDDGNTSGRDIIERNLSIQGSEGRRKGFFVQQQFCSHNDDFHGKVEC
jgi:hypothetical protein